VEIIHFIAERGEVLARTATSGLPLPDELKARVLNTFLTLMNLRENLDRAALRVDGAVGIALSELAFGITHGVAGAAGLIHLALALLALAEALLAQFLHQLLELIA
jgi:hypothetical protein